MYTDTMGWLQIQHLPDVKRVTCSNVLAPRYWMRFTNVIESTRKTVDEPDGGSVAEKASSGEMSLLRAVK